METIFSLMDKLPFDFISYSFMKHALLATLLVTPLFGILSTMVVESRMAFFSDSLGHGAFTGIAVGAVCGIFSPKISLLIFSMIFALLITYIKHKTRMGADTVIGVFSSTAVALGLMLMTYGGEFQKYAKYLIGDLLSIKSEEILALAVVFALTFLIWAFMYNKLLIGAISPSVARSREISPIMYEAAFASVLAVIVAISIEWVGILLINSLLVLPAAAARNVTNNVRSYHLCSVLFAVLSGVTGLIAAFYADTSAGATIVTMGAALFFVTLFLRKRFIK
ncbi:MAG: metal ABC transporter permease [Selenomonadaceae bacterium]|nr:metal ABC transporter permease [Selenomonadaceae bacterium]